MSAGSGFRPGAAMAGGAARCRRRGTMDRRSRSPTGYNFRCRLTESGSAKGGPHT